MVCISEALHPEVIAIKKAVFQVRYLRWKVLMVSNWALVPELTPGRRIQSQNAFNVLETIDPSLYGGVQAQSCASNQACQCETAVT